MIPDFVQALLDDLAARRQQLEALEAGLRATYGAAESEALPVQEARPRRARAVVPPATPEPVPAARPRRLTSAAIVVPSAGKRRGTEGSKYDEGMLRALKGEQAQHGLTASDLCRVFTGPGKPAEVQRISGGISIALQQLQKRGLVRKDGRHWYIVRDGEAGAA